MTAYLKTTLIVQSISNTLKQMRCISKYKNFSIVIKWMDKIAFNKIHVAMNIQHFFLFVEAPSPIIPCTKAPAFSSKQTAFITSWERSSLETGLFDANTAIG